MTDVEKLLYSGFKGQKAVLIHAYEYPAWPSDLAIRAFEALAEQPARLRSAGSALASGLVHPVHKTATVYAWKMEPK